MSDGQIFINHGHAESFADDMTPFNNQVTTIITNLEASLAKVVAYWEGADQVFYSGIQRQWNEEVTNLGNHLTAYGRVLSEASNTYKTAVNMSIHNMENTRF
ncbi:WXG100 family type VII secretion target [Streptomyces broussonetiae]|uniref:WXG100 family type VII secretion target n=1 Tax=Streptomyces broussonetiae TaxID=2686304 RepID=UPI0035DC02F1